MGTNILKVCLLNFPYVWTEDKTALTIHHVQVYFWSPDCAKHTKLNNSDFLF
jgi:hypothetical protein